MKLSGLCVWQFGVLILRKQRLRYQTIVRWHLDSHLEFCHCHNMSWINMGRRPYSDCHTKHFSHILTFFSSPTHPPPKTSSVREINFIRYKNPFNSHGYIKDVLLLKDVTRLIWQENETPLFTAKRNDSESSSV